MSYTKFGTFGAIIKYVWVFFVVVLFVFRTNEHRTWEDSPSLVAGEAGFDLA